MTLKEKYEYEICKGVEYVQNEEKKVLDLLRDVRASVALLRPDVENQRLDDILEVVEKGKWILQKKVNPEKPAVELSYNIDLSEAKQLIDDYRKNSEGGCQSCKNLRRFFKNMETYKYCKIGEDESSVLNPPVSNLSSKIEKFYKEGCGEDKEVKIKTKLEELLEGQN